MSFPFIATRRKRNIEREGVEKTLCLARVASYLHFKRLSPIHPFLSVAAAPSLPLAVGKRYSAAIAARGRLPDLNPICKIPFAAVSELRGNYARREEAVRLPRAPIPIFAKGADSFLCRAAEQLQSDKVCDAFNFSREK